MFESEYAEEIMPVGEDEFAPWGADELSTAEWNEIMAIPIDEEEELCDLEVYLPDDERSLSNDDDLPEMAEIIHNVWDC